MLRLVSALPVFLTVFTACATPSPRFLASGGERVSVGGMTFAVWRDGDDVSVTRTSVSLLPSRSAVRKNARRAIEMTTGCTVVDRSLRGDASLVQAQVDCGTDV